MKKLSKKIQRSDLLTKFFILIVLSFVIAILYITLDALIFFLNTTVGFIGLLTVLPFVSLGIMGLLVIKYPDRKELNEYSNYVKKYVK
ncbi:putative membrane protein [Staphylococcus phage Twort]|uniref:ORF141 n=2 Tax=Staphylococcus phage Twort (strain DSM 17442 / HER 48) TaxID=2908167 RepID=Q4Z900_BPTWO|nr:ORF141 [Staphylococcus phage Twort]AAX92427.1 ORF141 [Staphylococcus phage Twort]QIW89064.1 putative membrane protein [Staphylococcus phage Twort]